MWLYVRRLAMCDRFGDCLLKSRDGSVATLEPIGRPHSMDPPAQAAEDLLAQAWDGNADPFTNSPRVTISHLRKKLGEPRIVHTVAGSGYYVAEVPR